MNVAATLAAGVALGGCSLLLDFDQAGLACDTEGQCLQGYVCTGDNVCMPENHASTLCEPECGELKTCVKSKCVPICDERACPAGHSCIEGECSPNPRELKLGSPCETDAECPVSQDVCLLPYGGGLGVCTRPCSVDGDCDARAPKCVQFDNGQSAQRGLCANPAFKPCSSETTCSASSLSCGVYAFRFGANVIEPISACRDRLTGNDVKAIGEECGSAIPCANGLCIQTAENGRFKCTAPCKDNPQCNDLLGGTVDACLAVTLNPKPKFPVNTSLPTVRPLLCVQGGASIDTPCAGGCRADAPICVELEPTVHKCLPACGDGNAACPTSMSCQPNPSGTGPDVCMPEST